jgi:hypothetical protein
MQIEDVIRRLLPQNHCGDFVEINCDQLYATVIINGHLKQKYS